MSITIGLFILAATAVSSFISGIFGMAGGMILMGIIIALVPVSTAMILHGAIMMIANGWRAYLLRGHIDWSVFGRYLIGAVLGIALLFLITWRPDKTAIYLILSLVPIVVWLPRNWIDLDVRKPGQAEFTGFIVQAMNTLAGVAGPILDIFFVRTDMSPSAIVATKSATQSVSHLVKASFWSAPLLISADDAERLFPPVALIATAIPTAMLATFLGKQILQRMGAKHFRNWVKTLVSAIGMVYFLRALSGYGWI